jgi:hypothetical protein
MVEGTGMFSLIRESFLGKLDSWLQIFENLLWEREITPISGDINSIVK